jgi:hypothetical protein
MAGLAVVYIPGYHSHGKMFVLAGWGVLVSDFISAK